MEISGNETFAERSLSRGRGLSMGTELSEAMGMSKGRDPSERFSEMFDVFLGLLPTCLGPLLDPKWG